MDITIITSENVNELTDIRVARCFDGIISFKITSVRTSKKSSENEPIKPLRIMMYGLPVKVNYIFKTMPYCRYFYSIISVDANLL